MMKINALFAWICALTASFLLSGCLFADIISTGLGLHEESPTPLAADAAYLYRGTYTHPNLTSDFATKLERISLTDGSSSVILGTGTSSIVDGVGSAVRFGIIQSIAVQPGNPTALYIADGCVIRKVIPSTLTVTTVAGQTTTCIDADGTGTGATFGASIQALTYSDGYLYISVGPAIKKMNLATGAVVTIAGNPATPGNINAIGTAARLTSPGALVVAKSNLYVFDVGVSTLKKIALTDNAVGSFAGNGTAGLSDGIGTAAQLNVTTEHQLTTDGENYIFFTQTGAIRKVDLTNQMVTTILNSTNNREDIDGPLATAKIYEPSGLVYTTKGLFFSNIYGVRRLR